MDFVAIDVETANADIASICQIGIVTFRNGNVEKSWQSLVNPEADFCDFNTRVHGIDQHAVRKAPTFPDVYATVRGLLSDVIVASHTAFDRHAMARVVDKYGLEQFDCTWLDTATVARRAWPEFSRRGFGLANLASKLDIDFTHHDAEEDARAAGHIFVCALRETETTIRDWLDCARSPVSPTPKAAKNAVIEGNPNGRLFGEVVVFTGSLSITRREAARMAADAGCCVVASVGDGTTLLVVGEHDVRQMAGRSGSAKQRKAAELIERGHSIRVLCESDFQRLIRDDGAL